MTGGLLVLGLGNPLRGDDGIGPRVIEALQDRGLPSGVEVIDGGTGGLGLVNMLSCRQRVIIVDAANMRMELVCVRHYFSPRRWGLCPTK